MASILAIESDRKRQELLATIIRDHVRADLAIVDSVDGAIAAFTECTPDVIVAPALLSPRDSERLISHVRKHAAPYVQMVTIPALDMLVEPPAEENRGLGIFKRRRPASLGLQYDPAMVGTQIADRLEGARALRAEHEAAGASRLPKREVALAVSHAPNVSDRGGKTEGRVPEDRRCALRTPQRGSQCAWSVHLPWGTSVDLVNISRTGLLVESGSKVTPGITLELQLSGPGVNRVVLARFVRSEIARVDRLGVRYHAAAQFEQPLDVLGPAAEPAERSTAQSLGTLLSKVLSESDHQPEAASIRFARGLRSLVAARDVHIRHAPIAPVDDSESIYFHVAGEGPSRAILQVMFERDGSLTAAEFRLLKAAASIAAAVLELERPAGRVDAARDRMSEVA